jgi:hypothetical protein
MFIDPKLGATLPSVRRAMFIDPMGSCERPPLGGAGHPFLQIGLVGVNP